MSTERRSDQRGRPPDERVTVRIALRLAFIHGVEAEAKRQLGRPLTAEELRRWLLRYSGD